MKAFQQGISKNQLLNALATHSRATTPLVHAYGHWSSDRGCSLGCVIHDFAPGQQTSPRSYTDLFGIPEVLAHLEDAVFKALPLLSARHWPARFIAAITPGADLAGVADLWFLWLLGDDDSPLAPWRGARNVAAAANLYHRRLHDEEPSTNDWAAATDTPWDANWDGAAYLAYATAKALTWATTAAPGTPGGPAAQAAAEAAHAAAQVADTAWTGDKKLSRANAWTAMANALVDALKSAE